jgi:hypothetical protein
VGVIQSRAVPSVRPEGGAAGEGFGPQTVQLPQAAPGSVPPDGYLFVVVQGLVQVRVDASSGAVAAGDPLIVVNAVGVAEQADQPSGSAPRLGRALEPLARGSSLIWVLILGQ